jgi:hypothetical protein
MKFAIEILKKELEGKFAILPYLGDSALLPYVEHEIYELKEAINILGISGEEQ